MKFEVNTPAKLANSPLHTTKTIYKTPVPHIAQTKSAIVFLYWCGGILRCVGNSVFAVFGWEKRFVV